MSLLESAYAFVRGDTSTGALPAAHASPHPPPSLLESVRTPIIGGACGVFGRLIDYPLDTIKTRCQLSFLSAPAASAASAESPLQVLRATLASEGVRGLYRGCMTPCLGAAVEDGISFGVFHAVARMLGTAPPSRGAGAGARPEDLDLPLVFVSGSAGGMCTSFLSTPLELVKCRLQVDRVARSGGSGSGSAVVPRYAGPLDCLLTSVREEGARVLYRGHSATFLREALGTGCWFTTYECMIRTLAPGVPRDEVPTLTVLASGACSGMVLNAVPYPIDTVKSVLQTLPRDGSAPNRGLLDVLRLILRTQGVKGLYRGFLPALARAIPTNAAVFLMYEQLSRLWPLPLHTVSE